MNAGLSHVDREAFLQMVWAAWGLQQPEPAARARQILVHQPDAVTDDLGSRWSVRPWELEVLVNLLVQVAPGPPPPSIPCDEFSTVAAFCNLLRSLENTESETYLTGDNVLAEMHRIGQRQFGWQRGFINRPDFYRNFFLYGRGNCATFFEAHYGLSIESFTKVGFALFAQLVGQPFTSVPLNFQVVGIENDLAERAVALMTTSLANAGDELNALLRDLGAEDQPLAYRPSLLRRRPIMAVGRNGARLCAPLPPLIMLRISAGLYYDLLPGGRAVRDEVARQFEAYCRNFVSAVMPRFEVQPEYRYERAGAGNQVDSPDLIVMDAGRLALVVECKATKLTFSAQFAGDPAMAATDKYEELAKGVFQLWRFASHCRRGLTRHVIDDQARFILLTVDSWMVMSRGLQEHVLSRARRRAALEPGMEAQDQRPVVFAAIQDLEQTMLRADEDEFLRALGAASEERYLGWLLPNVGQDIEEASGTQKPYPFDIGDILPWWAEIDLLREDSAVSHG